MNVRVLSNIMRYESYLFLKSFSQNIANQSELNN